MTTDPNRRLADDLIAAGFLEGLPPERARAVEAQLRGSGYAGVFGHDWRAVMADDEALAEGAIAQFLDDVAPMLEGIGVAPLVGESGFDDEGSHVLELPGETVTLMTAAELERDASDQPHLAWGLVGARLFRRLNTHIEAAGRPDRIFAVMGGNDLTVLLLTPEMEAAILRHVGPDDRERPYQRTEEWPDFGTPGL